MRTAHRLASIGQKKYQGTVKMVNGHPVWTGKINFDEKALLIPLRTKKPTMYFVNSMSDLFHEDVTFEFIDQVFAVMALCPQHVFQVLTKRAERMAEYVLCVPQFDNLEEEIMRTALSNGREDDAFRVRPTDGDWPLLNVWLGVSCEDQKRADERISHLLKCPAAVRFLSCEPLLGEINLISPETCWLLDDYTKPRIHWVIVGGESGSGARSCDVQWIRDIVVQCRSAGVPVFVKQDSGPRSGMRGRIPDDLWIKEFPNAV